MNNHIQTVSVQEKKEFIRWFLKRYQMKRRECVWILNYLLNHDELLQNVHFVEEAHYCTRAMVMSVTESNGVPFRFYKGDLMTADAEKSFKDLRENTDEEMYIQLNFPNVNVSAEYLTVLEENSFIPNHLQSNTEDMKFAEQVIIELVEMQKGQVFEQLINEALDNGDKARFLELTSEYGLK